MNRIKYFHTIICLLLFSLLFSCIKEDLSNCPQQSMSFTFKDSGDDPLSPITDQDLQSLAVYIFDENDNYMNTIPIGNLPKLNTPYMEDSNGKRISLDPGKYNFVVWANVLPAAYNVNIKNGDPSTRNDNFLQMSTEGTRSRNGGDIGIADQTKNRMLRLFYSNSDGAVVVDKANNDFVFDLHENSNLLIIKVIGLPHNNDNHTDYSFVIEDSNNKYNFLNDFGDSEYDIAYQTMSSFTAASDTLTAQLRVLKLARGRVNAPELSIYKGKNLDNLIFHGNVIDLIDLNYASPNFNKQHRYEIPLEYLEDAFGNIVISINGWIVTENNDELFPD